MLKVVVEVILLKKEAKQKQRVSFQMVQLISPLSRKHIAPTYPLTSGHQRL